MIVKRFVLCAAMVMVTFTNHYLAAQDFNLTYTTEFQTDFRKGAKWVNLLRTDFLQSLGNSVNIEVASISVARTSDKKLVDDLQVYSNIEEENLPLALAILGINWHVGASSLFVGIRNLNEDYFNSPCTSLLTNSSCGIFPTLSANYPIANYPVASVGMDYKLKLGNWHMETSIYNGTGYNMFVGKENVFRFCPKTDGILSITSLNYQNNDSGYYMGIALHSGMSAGDESGNSETEEKKKLNTVLWGYAEQKLSSGLYALFQYSINPTEKQGCRSYVGSGLVMRYKKIEGGVFADYADFTTEHEWASELTCKFLFGKSGYVQPAFHLIANTRECNWVGLIRLGYEI